MTLDDDSSWEVIKTTLRNAEWTEEEIDNITEEQLVLVVEALNRSLVKTHKKSSKIFKSAKAKHDMVQKAYLKGVQTLYEQYGDEIPADQLMALFGFCVDAKQKVFQELGETLNERSESD